MPQLDKAGDFNSIKLAKGVYASLVTISKIEDLSNYPGRQGELNKRNDGEPYELCIKVYYEREDGEDWSTMFWGNFKKDKVTGKIQGWKAFGNGVQDFFETMYGNLEEVGNRLNDDWSISATLTEPLIGRKFYRISYISGIKDDNKGRYKDFYKIFTDDTTIETMQNVWAQASVKMKSYAPDAADELERMKEEEGTSFNYGANEEVDPEYSATPEDDEEFEL